MRAIVKPNGDVYAKVYVDSQHLQIVLEQAQGKPTIILDAKVIPQLRQILTEAEFFKTI